MQAFLWFLPHNLRLGRNPRKPIQPIALHSQTPFHYAKAHN